MTKSEEVYQKITGYANYSQMNGISKSWIIKCIDNALNEQLTIPVVSNFVIQEIERRRDLILSEPDGIVREQMINNLALEL
jgi:hypothetical protein